MMTLGSLFDGSGGFPLGGLLAGITPVWASEIEPFPIRVTTKRLPFMKHYGNVSEMDGGKVEPVDIITFGSPCQDMSVAGKRAGLEGSRSNLFYEAVRIIKEMRKATGGEYPKWACWENVPGAFSSSGGEDFRCVLESLCGVIDESVSIPKPKKWANAGEILGDGYSLAWRVLDAQFWGVPQRRKRIYLVADFTGGCAGKVLFESEGLSGYSPQGFRSWQTAPGDSANCSGTAGIGLNDQDGQRMDVTDDVTATLRAEAHHPPRALKIRSGCEGGGKGPLIQTDKSATLSCNNDQTLFEPCSWDGGQISPTLTKQNAGGSQRMPDKDNFNCVLQPFGICSKDSNAVCMGRGYTVRRLTPTECARLQGFPDWWCDDLGIEPTTDDLRYWYDVFETHRRIVGGSSKPKSLKQITKWLRDPHSDAAEYKMWGNGVALPCVWFVLCGIVCANG